MATSTPGRYLLGRGENRVAITTPIALSAVELLARGIDPRSYVGVSTAGIGDEIQALINSLEEANLLRRAKGVIALPKRYLAEVHHRDVAAQQLLHRAAPAERDAQWRNGDLDGGSRFLTERARHRILISGRSRIATLLSLILSQSGFTAVEFADRYEAPLVGALDIGTAGITERHIGSNYYELMAEHRQLSALFPDTSARNPEREKIPPTLIIHSGALDIDLFIDWMSTRQPHVHISPVICDEVFISPIVLPGESPCTRCAELHHRDRRGFLLGQAISFDKSDEISIVGAHYIAALVAQRVIAYIDSMTAGCVESLRDGVGEVASIQISSLERSQVETIARHPLCGCTY